MQQTEFKDNGSFFNLTISPFHFNIDAYSKEVIEELKGKKFYDIGYLFFYKDGNHELGNQKPNCSFAEKWESYDLF